MRREKIPGARPRLHSGGERNRRDLHGDGRGGGGTARDDREQRPRHQPDAGSRLLSRRHGNSLRHRRRHALRPRHREHQRRTERLFPGRQRRRARRLPLPRARSRKRAGNVRRGVHGLRTRRKIPHAGLHSDRRHDRPDDGVRRFAGAARKSRARALRARARERAHEPFHVDLPRSRGNGKEKRGAAREIPRNRSAGAGRGTLADGRRGRRARRLRHHVPPREKRDRGAATRGRQSRTRAAEAAVPVPERRAERARPADEKIFRRRAQRRADD